MTDRVQALREFMSAAQKLGRAMRWSPNALHYVISKLEPIELHELDRFTGLASVLEWVDCKCDKCGSSCKECGGWNTKQVWQ